MQKYNLRPYQQECKEAIEQAGPGRHLSVLATGLGKTVVFTYLENMGRTLILSHRDELVRQPEKYYAGRCRFGVEKAEEHASDEEIISASVQSLCQDARLHMYKPDAFETIIVDEAHHAAAASYRKILDYFSGAKQVIGFTATPHRGDGIRLSDVFDDIIFNRDLHWGIKNGYLSRIRCQEVSANYDLSKVPKVSGDFSAKQLEEILQNGDCIPVAAKAYMESCHTKGRHTLIYCVTRNFCRILLQTIRNLLPEQEKESVQMLDGDTPDDIRRSILADFSSGTIRCIINCMVLTEGTDLPICDAVMNLRPTCNDTLYQQMAGRGTRLYDGKDHCLLIDVIPKDMEKARGLCTAPSLFGLDPAFLNASIRANFCEDNDLLDVCEELSAALADQAKNVELKVKSIDLFITERECLFTQCAGKPAKALADLYHQFRENHMEADAVYDFGDLDVEIQAEDQRYYKITPTWNDAIYIGKPDILDNTTILFHISSDPFRHGKSLRIGGNMKMQEAIRLAKMYCELGQDWYRYAWNKKDQELWKMLPATGPQTNRLISEYKKTEIAVGDMSGISKLDASRLIDLMVQVKEAKKEVHMWQLSDSAKQTKKVREAKERVEKIRKETKEQFSSQERFEAFVKKIHEAYKKWAADTGIQAKPSGTITVKPDYLPKWRTPISAKQETFANSLRAKAEQYGCSFPELQIKDMTMREATVLISFLIQVNNQAFHGCGWMFSDVTETCRQSEQSSICPIQQFSFSYGMHEPIRPPHD